VLEQFGAVNCNRQKDKQMTTKSKGNMKDMTMKWIWRRWVRYSNKLMTR